MQRLFGASVSKDDTKPTLSKEEARQKELVSLQSKIDDLRRSVTQWDTQKRQLLDKAKKAKSQGDTRSATQYLQQKSMLEKQIDVAASSMAKLMETQTTLTVSSMIVETHEGMKGAHDQIRSNTSDIDGREFNRTLIADEKLLSGVDRMSDILANAGSLGRNAQAIEDELANLSTGDETDLYDFDDLVFPPSVRNNNNTRVVTNESKVATTTSTSKTTTNARPYSHSSLF